MRARFPIGLTFSRKRFPKAKEAEQHIITDIYTTRNNGGEIVRIEYQVAHFLLGQLVNEYLCDTAIARSLAPEVLALYA